MPSRPYMLSAASEKLQIYFRRSLWSSMLTNVTMPPVIAAAAESHQRHFENKKEKSLDIKKFESPCSFRSRNSGIGPGSPAAEGSGGASGSTLPKSGSGAPSWAASGASFSGRIPFVTLTAWPWCQPSIQALAASWPTWGGSHRSPAMPARLPSALALSTNGVRSTPSKRSCGERPRRHRPERRPPPPTEPKAP